jgi:hypothetical protein
MLNFPIDTKHEPKCAVTYGTMGHLDPKQPPVKRKPFAAILSHRFVQKVCHSSLAFEQSSNKIRIGRAHPSRRGV